MRSNKLNQIWIGFGTNQMFHSWKSKDKRSNAHKKISIICKNAFWSVKTMSRISLKTIFLELFDFETIEIRYIHHSDKESYETHSSSTDFDLLIASSFQQLVYKRKNVVNIFVSTPKCTKMSLILLKIPQLTKMWTKL